MSTIHNARPNRLRTILTAAAVLAAVGIAVWFAFWGPGGLAAKWFGADTESLQPGQSALEAQGFLSGQTSQGASTADRAARLQALSIPVSGTLFTAQAVASREGVEISGNLQAGASEDIALKAAGTVVYVGFEVGDSVRPGQTLVRLDTSDMRYQIASREYEIEQERLSGSPRKLELLEMSYDLLTRQLADYTAAAPIAGRVASVSLEPGDTASKGQTVMRIIDTGTLRAVVQVDELDIPKIETGQEVEVVTDAVPGASLFGRVVEIALEGTATGNGYAVFPVEIEFDAPDPRILPGFSFSGNIYVSGEQESVVVDRRAVTAINDTVGLVFAVDGETDTAAPVQVQYESHGQLEYAVSGTGIADGTVLMTPPAADAAGTADGGLNFGIPGANLMMGGGLMGGTPPSGSFTREAAGTLRQGLNQTGRN